MIPAAPYPSPAAPRSTAAATLLLLSVAVAMLLAPVGAVAQASGTPDPFRIERAGSGPPMILIPGLLSDGAVWDATVQHFANRYETHVLTLTGFAGTPPIAADPYVKAQRDAVVRYIDAHELDRPVLLGHSLGAFLALWIAATVPERVGPVVAVDGVPFFPALNDPDATPSAVRRQAETTAAMFEGLTPEQLEAQTRMAVRRQIRDAAHHDRVVRWGGRSDASTAARVVREMMTTDLRDDVARIEGPALLMMAAHGLTDAEPGVAEGRYRAQVSAVPDHRVVVATDARHFVMLDDPEFLHDAVADFLADQ